MRRAKPHHGRWKSTFQDCQAFHSQWLIPDVIIVWKTEPGGDFVPLQLATHIL
jgi:hypothetical protein